MIEDTVLDRINRLLTERKITRYRLARLTGISESALSKMFRHHSTLSLPTIERICDALDISVSQFFADNDDFLDLSPTQQDLIRVWSRLSPAEQDFVFHMIAELQKVRPLEAEESTPAPESVPGSAQEPVPKPSPAVQGTLPDSPEAPEGSGR